MLIYIWIFQGGLLHLRKTRVPAAPERSRVSHQWKRKRKRVNNASRVGSYPRKVQLHPSRFIVISGGGEITSSPSHEIDESWHHDLQPSSKGTGRRRPWTRANAFGQERSFFFFTKPSHHSAHKSAVTLTTIKGQGTAREKDLHINAKELLAVLKGVFRAGSPVEKLARSPSVGQRPHSRYDSEGRLLRVPRPPHTMEVRSSNQPGEHLLSFGPIHSRQVQSPADALSRHRLPDRMVPGSQNLSMDNATRGPVQHGHGCHPIKRSNRTVRLSVPSSPGDPNERSSDGLVPISENLRFSPLRFGPGTHSHSAPTQGGAHRIVTEPRVFL